MAGIDGDVALGSNAASSGILLLAQSRRAAFALADIYGSSKVVSLALPARRLDFRRRPAARTSPFARFRRLFGRAAARAESYPHAN